MYKLFSDIWLHVWHVSGQGLPIVAIFATRPGLRRNFVEIWSFLTNICKLLSLNSVRKYSISFNVHLLRIQMFTCKGTIIFSWRCSVVTFALSHPRSVTSSLVCFLTLGVSHLRSFASSALEFHTFSLSTSKWLVQST